jgi:membrane-associated phospholipid phosphatase
MMSRWRRLLCALPLVSSVLPGSPARAQGGDAVLFDRRDLILLTSATAGSALISRWDKPLAKAFADSSMHSKHPALTTASKRASIVTETVIMGTGGVVYGIAKWNGSDNAADIAFHTTEGVLSAAMFIQVVRGALGRGRPYVVDDSGTVRDPYDFNFLRGFTSFDYRSWPSMHAMASFAAAAGLASEMRWRETPNRKAWSAALYTGAAVPSLARMYLDEHWASDIAMGVFLGVFAGQKAVNYSHAHPDNRPDNFFLGKGVRATITLNGGSTAFSITPAW